MNYGFEQTIQKLREVSLTNQLLQKYKTTYAFPSRLFFGFYQRNLQVLDLLS